MNLTARNITCKILSNISRFGVGCCNHDGRELPNIKTPLSLYGIWEPHLLSDLETSL